MYFLLKSLSTLAHLLSPNTYPKIYNALAQIWAVGQGKEGMMYFGNGNGNGLLEFDGVNWQTYPTPNGTTVRSIDVDSLGRIWIGSVNEFGCYSPDSLGRLKYTSISRFLPDSLHKFGDVWKTISVSSGVHFFTKDKIFRWADNKITTIGTDLRPTLASKISDKIYVSHITKGLCVLNDTSIIELINAEQALSLGKGYKSICEYKDNQILIVTGDKGFFVYDIEAQNFYQPEMDTKVIEYLTLNSGGYSLTKINNQTYAAGTFKGGIVVINDKFELTDIINYERGIQNNCVYNLFTDKDDHLWAGLQSGIAYVNVTDPLRKYGEKQNMNAFSSDAVSLKNKKYVATLNGCFVLDQYAIDIEKNNHKFKYIPNLDNCWDLLLFKDRLFACGRFGFSQIVDASSRLIDMRNGAIGFSLGTSPKFPNHIFVGYRGGFSAYELVTKGNLDYLELKSSFHFPEITGEVRSITADENGDLWLGLKATGGVYIRFTSKDISNYKLTFFDSKNGLPNTQRVKIVNFDNKLNVLTSKGIYKPSKKENDSNDSTLITFEHDKSWGKYFTSDSNTCTGIIEVSDGLYLHEDVNPAFLIKRENKLVFNRLPFTRIPMIIGFVPEGRYINITTDNSFYVYDTEKDSVHTHGFQTLIRKVTIAKDSSIFEGVFYAKKGSELLVSQEQAKSQIPSIEYLNNSMNFHFAALFYENPKKTKYAYSLKGFNDEWSTWSIETKAIFTNIPEGKYTFQVKAKNIYGVESEITSFEFEIFPPWHRTIYVYVFYFLFLIGLIWAIVTLNTRRLIKEKVKLESTVKERTEEVRLQKEEILAQNEELMQANEEVSATSDALTLQNAKLAKSYTNVQLLSVIGQKITSKLSVRDIIDTVYENVNSLMDAEAFSIGIVNEYHNRLDFHGIKEKGKTLPFHFDTLNSQNKLSVYCYNNFATILLEDYDVEIGKYLSVQPGEATAGESTHSLIYLPLGTSENKMGVISVQSFSRNAYTDYHLNILKNIAIYTSIALQNSEAYSQIKQQHGQIKSSVNYASTIQNSILPSKEYIDNLFDNFIIYRPKDIVSGDFYWLSQQEGCIFIAVVDCTGHGVPGAFMSMIGSRLLSEIVNEKKILETNEILEELNIGIKKALRQEQTDNTDGMDVCLCKIEKSDTGTTVSFTGAKNPLFVYQNDKSELLKIRGDKKTIGGHHFQGLSFTQTKLVLQKGDMVYLTTDGFIDQNNKNRKKITTSGLTSILEKNHDKSLSKQREALESKLDTWQGKEHQRDDITILGIKI
jgi:serine phosphatase RsbU (regulator of sigma subunit)